MTTRTAPYGAWESSITTDLITARQIGLAEPRFAEEGLFWLESRPFEQGRIALVRRSADGQIGDVVADRFNVRTRVHEMGGGAYAPGGPGVVFSDDATGRLHLQVPGSDPTPITPADDPCRYADFVITPAGDGLIAVRERHGREGPVTNDLVWIPIDGSGPGQHLVGGADFYAFPRVSPDGRRLLWTCWNHPQMPWDGTELWVGEFDARGVGERRKVAGGMDESVFQPEWSPSGEISFVSDRTGWWNLYLERGGACRPIHPKDAEFGLPQWVFGLSRYAWVDRSTVVAAWTLEGRDRLAIFSPDGSRFEEWSLPYTAVDAVVSNGSGRVALIGGAASRPTELAVGRPGSAELEVLRSSLALEVDAEALSIPEHMEFPSANGRNAYAFFYPPRNPAFEAGPGTKPPLIVTSHGGPTGAASSGLNLSIQFWTSRGFAVVDVNYGGSTGYGREYRKRLDGEWGVVDVEDCVHAARFLAGSGRVDPLRLVIRGKSASGLTTLSALVSCDLFRAGAIHYGVADLEALARDTHKFESRYMDGLIGPYPEARQKYRERSPIQAVDRLSTPLIIFQGLEDRIVPPSQAETMVGSLDARRLPYAYLVFSGEGHGFRQASTIRRALEAELYFYGRVLGFEPAGTLEPVLIHNLTDSNGGN